MQIAFWMRRALLAAIVLLALAWLAAFADQWWLRWRGRELLAEVRSIEVGKTSEADIRRLITEWGSVSPRDVHYCSDEGCDYGVLYSTYLPEHLIGYPDQGVHNWLPRLVSRMGLRRSAITADLKVKDGVVISKSFAEDVALPPRVWFDRKGAWVQDLLVSSREVEQVGRYDGDRVYLHRAVRRFKGEYGIIVVFDQAEGDTERAELLNFRLHCITQFSPCLDEGEVLPQGKDLLTKSLARLRSDNAAASKE